MLDDLVALLDRVNAGDAGLRSLVRLLEIGQDALGARGMAFVEYASAGGRVIAVTGDLAWALGRPVDTTRRGVARLLAGSRIQEYGVDELPVALADQLRERGLHRMVLALAKLGGVIVGSLHAYFAEAEPIATRDRHAVVGFLTTSAAHIYGHRNGLPAQGDGLVTPAVAEGLAILTESNEVRLWNMAAERATGLPAAAAIGRPVALPVPPLGQSLEHRLPDGRRLQVSCADLPGTKSRVVTILDTTDVRRRERDRDLFIAVTSHELRTPVTVIKGYADTLTEHWESLDEAARRDAVRVLGQRAGDLARLVDRLLTAASAEGWAVGGGSPVPFDLVDAVREAVAGLPSELRRSVRVALPGSLPRAYGNRASVATVLAELATNAVKYSPREVDVSVTVGADLRTVFFEVADRGIGVRAEHVERAFERFWQGDVGDQRRYAGVGLGLFLVRRIVERQNGWVSLRPRAGGGTVAQVRLPRADGPAGEVQA
ncbi:MAG TPA: ATP-binding protein [Micromonosporaceae bacterium]|nr:ATP-binding protein [Micromonosporaceae bacterium]